MSERVLYFGCIEVSGHFLHEKGGRCLGIGERILGPLARALDGSFCPPASYMEGIYKVSTVPPWTIISWLDRSQDRRHGSHSTFLFSGFEDLDAMWAAARREFPQVFTRLKYELKAGAFYPDVI